MFGDSDGATCESEGRDPGFRFYTLSDKVWREDVLAVAWQALRRNGLEACGVDCQTFERRGTRRGRVARGTGERSRSESTYLDRRRCGSAIEEAAGVNSDRWAYHVRDRVAQTAAMLVKPIFEADLQAEQCLQGRRSRGRSAPRAAGEHRSARGYRWTAIWSNYFGEILHAEIDTVARRVSDGRMLGWIKLWLEMAVRRGRRKGGRRRTNRARRERKGTPQGAPISPLLSNVYLRTGSFWVGSCWAMPGGSARPS